VLLITVIIMTKLTFSQLGEEFYYIFTKQQIVSPMEQLTNDRVSPRYCNLEASLSVCHIRLREVRCFKTGTITGSMQGDAGRNLCSYYRM